jgi:hypothetical protein
MCAAEAPVTAARVVVVVVVVVAAAASVFCCVTQQINRVKFNRHLLRLDYPGRYSCESSLTRISYCLGVLYGVHKNA